MAYGCFHLALSLTHACNLRCGFHRAGDPGRLPLLCFLKRRCAREFASAFDAVAYVHAVRRADSVACPAAGTALQKKRRSSMQNDEKSEQFNEPHLDEERLASETPEHVGSPKAMSYAAPALNFIAALGVGQRR
jgi:hypothetical protein